MFIKGFFHVCMDMNHIYSWCLQKSEEGINLLDLELWVVVNHLGGTRNPAWVLCKSNKCL